MHVVSFQDDEDSDDDASDDEIDESVVSILGFLKSAVVNDVWLLLFSLSFFFQLVG